MKISSIRHDWPEQPGFTISRPQGWPDYTFLHFLSPVRLLSCGEIIEVRPGGCIFYSPKTPQWFCATGPLLHNWMHPEPAFGLLLEKYSIPQNQILYPENPGFISDALRQLETEYFSRNPFRDAMIECMLEHFLISFARATQHGTATIPLSPRTREKLRSIRQQVLSNPENPWTVETMASLMNLSVSRFHALYKALFGSSPMQDVIDARVNRSRHLLLNHDQLSISAIAELTGYHDPYHFIRQFKAVTGMTPGTFRKNRQM